MQKKQANHFSEEVGKRIREKRIASGLTQEQIANRLGILRQSYTDIEKGFRPLKDEEIVILADVFGTTTESILRDRDPDNICKVTGLSNDAVSFFHKASDCSTSSAIVYYQTIISCLNDLLSTDQGNEVLHALGSFLNCDYSQAYIDKTGDGLTFEPLNSHVGFEIQHSFDGIKSYHFYNTDLFEQTAQVQLLQSISDWKRSLHQTAPKQIKRVRGAKK